MSIMSPTIRNTALVLLFVLVFFLQIKPVTGDKGTDLLRKGDEIMLQGRSKYKDAIKYYTEALDHLETSAHHKAYWKRGELHDLMRNYEAAISDMDSLIELKPSKGAYKMRAKANTMLGNFKDAANDWTALASIDPKKQAEYQQKARQFQTIHSQVSYITTKLAELETADTPDPVALRQVRQQCMTLLGEVLTHAKANTALRYQRVECALGVGDHNLVRSEVQKLLEKNKNDQQALYLNAKSLNLMGAVESARKVISQCFSIDQDFRPCIKLHKTIKAYGKANTKVDQLRETKRYQDTLDAIAEAEKVDPAGWNNNEYWRYRCTIYYNMRKVHEALQACNQCIENEEGAPTLLDVYLQRSDVHVLNDDLEAAQQDINTASELEQNNRKVREKQANLDRLKKMAERKDYYKILGVKKTATEKEIKSAYRKLAMQHHPDHHRDSSEADREKAEKRFRDIAEAKEVLCDEEKRGKYDRGEDLDEQQHQGHNPFQGFGGSSFSFRFG